MLRTNIFFILFMIYCLLSVGECGVVPPQDIVQMNNGASALECSQFHDDYDILNQFPFPVVIDPFENDYFNSTASMDENDTFVKNLYIREQDFVPPSAFCLSKLENLMIETTPFPDDIPADAFTNLKELRWLHVSHTSFVKLVNSLTKLTNLSMLMLKNCSLTQMPNLSNLQRLSALHLSRNHLSEVDGIPSVQFLSVAQNLFTQIPTIKDKNKLKYLFMTNNPLKTAASITSFANLEVLFLDNTTLTSIPPNIDKLQKLKQVDLSNNKLSYLPTNLRNLPHLEKLMINNNFISSNDIQSIRKAFEKSHPDLKLTI